MNPVSIYSLQSSSALTQSRINNILGTLGNASPTAILLQNTLNSGPNGSSVSNGATGLVSQFLSNNVHINTDAIRKNLWNQLDKKVNACESKNPDMKGNYVVAIKQDQTGNLPTYKIVNKADVLSQVGADNQKLGEQTIKDHPVQVFSISNIDNLKSVNPPGLDKVVSDFITKNKNVFRFLNSMS
jgi:hypothetical protein